MNSKNCNAMKKIFTKLMLLAVAAAALVSCENNYDEQTLGGELTQTVTLLADKPTEVRTQLIEGVPYWSKGDKIGVYTEEKNLENEYYLTNDAEEATLTTTFTGQTALSETIYVFYPSKGYGSNLEKGAKTEIPAIQHPTATSFDGAADIMFAKPVTLNEEGQQLSGLEFARVGAIVKVVLNDKTGNLADQHISTVKMTAATNLVGRVYLDVINQELGELYYDRSTSVSAEYAEPIAANNPVYLVVYPQTLDAGSKLSFEATTEGYAISRELIVPEDKYPNGIVLEPGKVTTLNVSLAADNLVKEETGLALPIVDDFSWVTSNTESNVLADKDPEEKYSSFVKVYPASTAGALKLGTSNDRGSFTTVDLNLSQPFTVVVDAMAWIGTNGADSSTLTVTVGETTMTSEALGSQYKTYTFEFPAAGKKEKVTLGIGGKRGYIDNLYILAGHDVVLPPVLTVSTEEISGVSHEGEAKTFTYSVKNTVEGVSATVTDNVDWITIADNNGTVTVTVAANELEEAREGAITVTYGDLTKTVTVKQNAKPAEGGNEGGEVVETTVTFVSKDHSYANGAEVTSAIVDSNISLAFASGSKYYNTGEGIRVYGGKYFTVSSSTATITKITLTFGSGDGSNAISADCGTFTSPTWTGSSNSVKFSLAGTSGHRRIAKIEITYQIGGSSEGGNTGGGEGGETPDPTPDPEPDPEQPGTPTVGSSYSYSFTAKTFSAVGTQTLGNLDWTFAGTPKSSHYFGYDGTKGQQFGSGNNPYNSLTLTTNNYQGGVKKIVINTSGASSINAKMTVTVGGTQIGATTSLTATSYTLESTEILSGDIVISYTNSSSKAIYIKSIAIN